MGNLWSRVFSIYYCIVGHGSDSIKEKMGCERKFRVYVAQEKMRPEDYNLKEDAVKVAANTASQLFTLTIKVKR